MRLIILALFMYGIDTKVTENISAFCANLHCDDDGDEICGIRPQGDGYVLRLFQSECALLKYGCSVQYHLVFGATSMYFCKQTLKTGPLHSKTTITTLIDPCVDYDCSFPSDADEVCGIKEDGEGFKVRLFENKCQLWKYNCKERVEFTVTELYICRGVQLTDTSKSGFDNETNYEEIIGEKSSIILNNTTAIEDNPKNVDNIDGHIENPKSNMANITQIDDAPKNTDDMDGYLENLNKTKNIIVLDSSMIDYKNVNESFENFFSATHMFNLPLKEINEDRMNDSARRMLVKTWGPVKVFQPWVTIPKNISDDFDHRPTLSTCFHKCPTKCPSTYVPVCGVPGTIAREPSIMFQNHCFMDVAQCKMYRENKSPTALSSVASMADIILKVRLNRELGACVASASVAEAAKIGLAAAKLGVTVQSYIETSFVFCLGQEMNGMFRFLPLVRTLQHMGRLRKKGHFRYKFSNMKFFNNLLSRQPKLMG